MKPTDEPVGPPSSRVVLIVAAAVSILVGRSYIGQYLLYPFTLLATWVHEMGHGLTARALGGAFLELKIFWNASGVASSTSSNDFTHALVALGGLLAPPLVGALVLACARGPRRARAVLAVLALALAASAVIWVRSVAGLVSMPLLAVLGFVVARWGSARQSLFLAQLIGLRVALDTFGRFDYLFMDSAVIAGQSLPSDIAVVARGFGGPRIVWSCVVAAISVVLVLLGLYAAWRRGKPTR